MTTGQISRRTVALAAAYAIALNALFSMVPVVKPAAGALHRLVCTSDRTPIDDRSGAPDPLGSSCIAICAALASASSDGAMDRVENAAAPTEFKRFWRTAARIDAIACGARTGAYLSRAPPRA